MMCYSISVKCWKFKVGGSEAGGRPTKKWNEIIRDLVKWKLRKEPANGGGILLFVRENIPWKIIKTDCDADFDGIFVEINLRKKKWLLYCSYNPHKSNVANHLKNICKTLDKLSATYDNLILLGDFNVEPDEESIPEILNLFNLKNLVKQKHSFQKFR